MEDKVDEDFILDYALFHISPTKNSYDALACSKGKIERVIGGHLDQLAACLLGEKTLQFNEVDTSFKLQLAEGQKGFSWFTRGTLKRFLHIVNTPEAIKDGYTIMGEIAQLEETKKFHNSLYAKDQDQSSGLEADINSMKDVGLNQQLKVETLSSDATKNELLRALDLRLLMLEEELAASFDRASGVTCFRKHISDISAFIGYFGSTNLRNLVSKLSACRSKNKPCESFQNMKGSTDKLAPQAIPKSSNTLVSPAKIAQIERESSSESDDSSDSNDEDQLHSERSRLMTRSATPRRSASPMRRIQIGRSGSRRSTPITIKSFNYFPARERISSQRDNTDENNSGNEDGGENQTMKPENTVRRMSVQDAISLFEHKQKDQKADVQKISATSTNTAKSVLRRWSAGMGDSFAQTSHASTSDSVATSQNTSEEANKNEEEATIKPSNSDSTSLQVQNTTTETKVEEVNERATASAEWNRKKEAELNQMLMKMMETKPVKKQVHSTNNNARGTTASEQRGSFYSEYRKRRDEKLRTENLDKRIIKEAQIKVIKESLEVSKLKMISKNVHVIGKDESSDISQKPRRKSAPPILPKKDVSKSTNTKKASTKATSLPATRKSLPQLPSPKTSANAAPRTPGAVSTSSATTNRRRLVSTPSPTPPTASKIKKGTPANVKPNLNGRQENSQKSTGKSNKSPNTKKPSKPVDDSRTVATKPSFYNKVTKKGSIVPLESKPVIKKSSGLSPKPKPKISQPEDSANNCEKIIQPNVFPCKEAEAFQPTNINVVHEAPLNSAEIKPDDCTEYRENNNEIIELSIPETQEEVDDIGISSPAWVEVNNQVESASRDIELPSISVSPEITSEAPLSSPKVRHSLSQMLKADNNEPEIIEWGNAENPPALVYQKDAPKGFKRLLKFARKSKGELNISGFSSPSVFSEGDDDGEEPKANSKRSSDLILRKAALQAQGYDLPKSILTGSSDSGSSRKWSVDNREANDKLTAQPSNTSTATMLDRLREGQNSSSSSNKATRSFFSLSTFRSSKSSETKL